jgi:ubiquinone/menaquinone biosynthesis C-methylase UbiE
MAQHVCPWWIGYLLASPLRRMFQDPYKILQPYVLDGMTVLEVGPAMGFFTLPLAEMVGPRGKVACVDVQEKMIRVLQQRAAKAGVGDRIVTRVCEPNSLGLKEYDGQVDFALAFAVIHEVPDTVSLMADIARLMKPGARFLMAEPKGHVAAQAFQQTLATAEQKGFQALERPVIRGSHSVLLLRK